MSKGAVAVAHTIEGAAVMGSTSKIQSIEGNRSFNEHKTTSLRDPDYGWALWDLSEGLGTKLEIRD